MENCLHTSATKQGIALSLVDLHEVKLTLRPKDGTISTNVIITQSVVFIISLLVIFRFLKQKIGPLQKLHVDLVLLNSRNIFMHWSVCDFSITILLLPGLHSELHHLWLCMSDVERHWRTILMSWLNL